MRHWLMKSEPDCYSVDDLKRAKKPAMWEGCRNYTVRNFMRDLMKPGDLAFFYHSSCAEPGIVGLMEIVSEGYPDPTQFKKTSDYYDPKSPKSAPRWYTVDVRLVEKFKRTVGLAEMREVDGLQEMLVLRRGQRLSVMPVEPNEWAAVLSLPGLR